jgi:hypothetical protein
MRAGLLFGSPSIPEQTSEKALPDALISGCPAALFEATLPDEQTKQTATNMNADSKRMGPPSGWAKCKIFRIKYQSYSSRASTTAYLFGIGKLCIPFAHCLTLVLARLNAQPVIRFNWRDGFARQILIIDDDLKIRELLGSFAWKPGDVPEDFCMCE